MIGSICRSKSTIRGGCAAGTAERWLAPLAVRSGVACTIAAQNSAIVRAITARKPRFMAGLCLHDYVKGGWHLLRLSFGQSVLIHLTGVVVGTPRPVDLIVA